MSSFGRCRRAVALRVGPARRAGRLPRSNASSRVAARLCSRAPAPLPGTRAAQETRTRPDPAAAAADSDEPRSGSCRSPCRRAGLVPTTSQELPPSAAQGCAASGRRAVRLLGPVTRTGAGLALPCGPRRCRGNAAAAAMDASSYCDSESRLPSGIAGRSGPAGRRPADGSGEALRLVSCSQAGAIDRFETAVSITISSGMTGGWGLAGTGRIQSVAGNVCRYIRRNPVLMQPDGERSGSRWDGQEARRRSPSLGSAPRARRRLKTARQTAHTALAAHRARAR